MNRKLPLVILTGVLVMGLVADNNEIFKRAEELFNQKKFDKVLQILDQYIAQNGETEELLAARVRTLLALSRLDEALKTAIRRLTVAKRKSPWRCIEIVEICIKMNNLDEAFRWLDRAVELGFLSYTELYNSEFIPLHKDERFAAIIAGIKENIGIGKPAKDFSITLLGGERFTLSRQKGKVVLIDFWATWCSPCVMGIPHILELFEAYKDEGFEVVGISLDSDKKALDEYLTRHKLPWKIAFSGKAWSDDTARYYRVNLIPSYWLIDRDGILRDFGIPLRDKETLKRAVEKLIVR